MGGTIYFWFHSPIWRLLNITGKTLQSALVCIPLKLTTVKLCSCFPVGSVYLMLKEISLFCPQAPCRKQMEFSCFATKNIWPYHKEALGKRHGKVWIWQPWSSFLTLMILWFYKALLQVSQLSVTTGDAQIPFVMGIFSRLCWHNQQLPCWL